MSRSRITFAVAVAAGAALAGWQGLGAPEVRAADHGDAPGVRVDTRADINDVYVFQSPETPANTVFIMTVCPLAGITAPNQFAQGIKYQFAIDTNADAKENITYSLLFGRPGKDGTQSFNFMGPKGQKGRGKSETLPQTIGTDVKVFAGNRDDPFFFDLIAFRRGLAFSDTAFHNFFDGLNTLAIVVEVPTASLGSTSIGVWARTVKGKKQIDRMGRPAINTVLIGPTKKDAFNAGSPKNDVANFTAEVVDHLKALGNTDQEAADLAAVLLPDILTYDTTNAAGFLNGRKLTDDVIDAELNLLSKGAVTTDFVGNDSTFLTVFPYLGVKN